MLHFLKATHKIGIEYNTQINTNGHSETAKKIIEKAHSWLQYVLNHIYNKYSEDTYPP